MKNSTEYTVNPGWRLFLTDLGLNPSNIMSRAGIPDDIFVREKALITTEEYFRFWRAIEEEANDPLLPLRIGSAISVESFEAPLFAALSSPNLNTALKRLAHYKRLIGPMKLNVDIGPESTTVELIWLNAKETPPPMLVYTELVFFVELARIGTRATIYPKQVKAMVLPLRDEYVEYFGVRMEQGDNPFIAYRAEDANRPFLTANDEMWKSFEPNLQRRLSELDSSASTGDRVRATLMEQIPSGETAITAVAKKLGMSTRTLQRRLHTEEVNFQGLLSLVREELAQHYLKNSSLNSAEISFLLGFEDPNSFFRAYHIWTGNTPDQTRMAYQARS